MILKEAANYLWIWANRRSKFELVEEEIIFGASFMTPKTTKK